MQACRSVTCKRWQGSTSLRSDIYQVGLIVYFLITGKSCLSAQDGPSHQARCQLGGRGEGVPAHAPSNAGGDLGARSQARQGHWHAAGPRHCAVAGAGPQRVSGRPLPCGARFLAQRACSAAGPRTALRPGRQSGATFTQPNDGVAAKSEAKARPLSLFCAKQREGLQWSSRWRTRGTMW